MNGLPLHLQDEILFRLDPKSLAVIRCTNKSIKSRISDDPSFEIGYSSRTRSFLFNLSSYGSFIVNFQPYVSSCVSKSQEKEKVTYMFFQYCRLFRSCSGLLLLYIGHLFVVNPLTKRFKILDHYGSKFLREVVGRDGNYPEGKAVLTKRVMCVGFAVYRNQTTKRFKIVCILESQTMYKFEISDGNSWRLSETTLTTGLKSDLTIRMKPVFFDNTLHWLRNDGSIIAFNPETEQARFIPSIFHRQPNTKLLFESDDKINRLTLISGTKEEISIYSLVENTKWRLARQIKNVFIHESKFECWDVVAYDGKRLVVKDKEQDNLHGVAHVYDMEANSWGVLGITNGWAYIDTDFYKFTPSLSFVEEDKQRKVRFDSGIFDMEKVMGLVDTIK